MSSSSQPTNGPSFTLECVETGTDIHVFGVEHLAPQPHIGKGGAALHLEASPPCTEKEGRACGCCIEGGLLVVCWTLQIGPVRCAWTPAPTGEWIIRQRPQAVVVETAMGPEHGAVSGNVIRCGDQVGTGP